MKPRTNTSSSNLLAIGKQIAEPVSPHLSSDADSPDGYFPSMPLANGERRSRRNTRSKIRSYFHGSGQENGQSHSSEDEGDSPRRFADAARDVKRRLSRNDSSLLLCSSVGASAASSSSRLCTAETHGSGLDEDEVIKEQIKEKVWTDTLAAQNHVSSPIDEDKHPDSVMSPIRRRSLYTPGIATRSPEDILRKPPRPAQVWSQADRDYYYNPTLPESSPLSRLANLQPFQNGRSTPSELDYTHLGALKPGTLRVTNGAASPVPRDQNISPGPTSSLDTTSQDEYYTASESGKGEGLERSTADLVLENTSSVMQRKSVDTTSSIDINLQPASRHSHLEPVMTTSRTLSTPDTRKGRTTNTRIPNTDQTPQSCKSIKRKPLPSSANSKQPHQNSPKPFDCSPEPPSNYYQHESVTLLAADGSREAAFLKLIGRRSTQENYDEATHEDLGHVPNFPPGSTFQPTDSGYNSSASLNPIDGFTTNAKSGAPTFLPTHHLNTPSPNVYGDSYEMKPTERLSSASNIFNNTISERQTVTSDIQGGSSAGAELKRFSVVADTITSPIATPWTQLSSPERSRKLQKKRPKSQPPLRRIPMSADHSSIDHEIPPVPIAMSDLHSQRISKFPPLDQTYTDFHHTDTDEVAPSARSAVAQTRFPSPTPVPEYTSPKDTQSLFQKLASRARSRSRSRPRATQPSCESDNESIKSICRSPSWSEYGNKIKKERKKKEKEKRELHMQKESRSIADTEVRTRSRSRSRFRSRSRQGSFQHELSPTLKDFGTVTESLGAGPYDIARASPRIQQQVANRALQPHKISTAKPFENPKEGLAKTSIDHSRFRSCSFEGPCNPLDQYGRSQASVPSGLARPYSMYNDRLPTSPLPVGGAVQRDSAPQPVPASKIRQPEITLKPESMTDSSKAADDVPPAGSTNSIEDLIDKLLDAPDADSREFILEQIRQRKRGTGRDSCTTHQQISGESEKPSTMAEDPHQAQEDTLTIPKHSTPVPITSPPQSEARNPEKTEAGKAAAGVHVPSEMMFAGAPPIPPLPTAEYLQQQDARRSMLKLSNSKTLTPPQTQTLESPKKDLWAGCTMQTERRKASGPSSDWDTHRLAWSQRRRSAGEALLLRDRQPVLADAVCKAPPENDTQEPSRPPAIDRATTAGLEQLSAPQNGQKAFHKPWTPLHQQKLYQSQSMGSFDTNNKVAATTQAFERLTGRFEGGLLYGYEPGFGLGGSAGTRSTKTGATRKSVHISQGFGVDLSDVPIFVAPSK